MPVRVIGMIGVAPPADGATVHIIKGGISAPYLKSYAQAHDKAGFDLALVGYTASSAEGRQGPDRARGRASASRGKQPHPLLDPLHRNNPCKHWRL